MREKLERLYFHWLCWSMGAHRKPPRRFDKLFETLHEIPFRYSLPMDGNREEDGINLRYRYAEESGYDERMVASVLDRKPCSVLEMMTALCIRCEESIMDGYSLDRLPRTSTFSEYLFWIMLDNLGLSEMDDMHFDINIVEEAVDRFLDRDYEADGDGGLFILKFPRRDLRGVEIWYQMCWYLDELLGEEV